MEEEDTQMEEEDTLMEEEDTQMDDEEMLTEYEDQDDDNNLAVKRQKKMDMREGALAPAVKMQKKTVMRGRADRAAARAACNDDNKSTAPASHQQWKKKPKPGDIIRFQTMKHFQVTC